MLEGGGLILQLRAFKIENSIIDELADNLDLLVDKETPEIMFDTAVLHGIILLLNLAEFLENQIALKMNIKAALTVN